MRFFLEVDKMILNFMWRILNVWTWPRIFFQLKNITNLSKRERLTSSTHAQTRVGWQPGSPALLRLGLCARLQGQGSVPTHSQAASIHPYHFSPGMSGQVFPNERKLWGMSELSTRTAETHQQDFTCMLRFKFILEGSSWRKDLRRRFSELISQVFTHKTQTMEHPMKVLSGLLRRNMIQFNFLKWLNVNIWLPVETQRWNPWCWVTSPFIFLAF